MQSPAYVLIVDDDPDGRDMLSAVIEGAGFVVATAEDGQDALDRLRGATSLPFLILLDLMMPVMDGETFRRHQLEDEALASIRTLVVSASHDIHKAAGRMRAVAVTKPVDIDRLIELVKRASVGQA